MSLPSVGSRPAGSHEGCEACRAFVAQVDGVEAELRAGYREAPEFQPDSPGGAAAAERFLAGLAALQGDGSEPVSEQAARDAERFAKIFAKRPADGAFPDDSANPAAEDDPGPEPIPFERALRAGVGHPYLYYAHWAVTLATAAALLLALFSDLGREPRPVQIPTAGPTVQELQQELKEKDRRIEEQDRQIEEQNQEIERLRLELEHYRNE